MPESFKNRSFRLRLLACIVVAVSIAGCEAVGFYPQAVFGQLALLSQRQSVESLIEDTDTDAETRERLQLTQGILDYAEERMGLAARKRYSSYVHRGDEAVVWNVFAARPFEVEGKRWCYPVVGCTTYRGYFKKPRALRLAASYERRGFETYVGGAAAYSTLGWFNDPLLSTFIHWPEPDLVNLLLHELAHSKVWVSDDVAFNESFASFVGQRGARQWLLDHAREEAWASWQVRHKTNRAFRRYLLDAKDRLGRIYAATAEASVADRERAKAQAIAGVKRCYAAHRHVLGNGRYDDVMAARFNNAYLVSVGTYESYTEGFAGLFEASRGDWQMFFAEVERIADLEPSVRGARMRAFQRKPQSLAQQPISAGADDQDAEQIDCEAFLDHGLYGETTG